MPKGEWIITGGFPCQDISSVGYGKGLEGERSGLFYEITRLIGEIRPKYTIMENVSALLGWFDEPQPRQEKSIKNAEWETYQYQGIARCASCLSEIGYDSEWQIISAASIGASHERKRVWIIAYPSSERQKTPVFQNRNIKEKLQKMQGTWLNDSLGRIICSQDKPIPIKYFLRRDDGLSDKLDGIKGAGNAIVPQCAELIFNEPAFDKWRIG